MNYLTLAVQWAVVGTAAGAIVGVAVQPVVAWVRRRVESHDD